jgi:hypothetical protein
VGFRASAVHVSSVLPEARRSFLAVVLAEVLAARPRTSTGRHAGQAEHQGQVQSVRPCGQRLAHHPVAGDALGADAVPLQVPS